VTGWPVVVAVVGPTASGKSGVALALAERIGGEVVNADAYQVYRGMDIGTAKATPAERARIRHHLLDILDVTEELSVARYQRLGRAVLAELADRDVPAIVVGGSGLYLRALLDDLEFPGSDPAIRARWEAELAALGPQALHEVLAERDPQAAAHILPSNGRRIVRALEVGQMTGRGFPAQLPVDGPPLVPHLSIGLDLDRAELDARIARRTDRMLAEGLVAEVRGLLERGLREGRTASRALGYPQVIDLLEGRCTQAEAREAIVAATRAYARRQQRWFRRDPRTTWTDARASHDAVAAQVAARLADQVRPEEPAEAPAPVAPAIAGPPGDPTRRLEQ
jgi:tRNA dimethylallyltransferase